MKSSRSTFPSAIEACFLIFAVFLVELVVGAVMHQFRAYTGLEWRDLWGFLAIVGNGVVFSVVLHFKQQRYRDLFHASPNSVAATLGVAGLPAIMLVPGLLVLMSALQYLLLMLFPMSTADELMFERMMSSGIGSVLTVCVIAPLLEEMLFRGVILRSFLNQYSRASAIIGSAIIFAAAHFNVYQFFVGIFVGVVLGWLYERTRSLWPGIILHATYNSAITWLFFSQADGGSRDTWLPSFTVAFVMLAFSLAGALLLRRLLEPGRVTP